MPLVTTISDQNLITSEFVLDDSLEDGFLSSDTGIDNETGNEQEIEIESVAESRCSIQQFDVIKILGKGSFGEVFLVRKNCGYDKDTLYAMKMLRKATLKIHDRLRTRMERNILVEIQHPFIVKLKYAFQTSGKLYLIMDFLRGGDLFSRLNKDIMFTEEDAKFYLAEIASALSHLHLLGIIYRDLKPENILLDAEGHIALTDFGLSKISLKDNTEIKCNQNICGNAFSFCGTVEYMAPEIITGKGHSCSADWWSFGVLMYEMLTGHMPFKGENKKEIMNEILTAKLSMPSEFSSSAKLLIRQLFKRNPIRRLGYGNHGSQNIKEHEFFSSINWVALFEKKIRPPFKPVVSREEDAFFIDPEFPIASDSPGIPVSANSHELFRGFSFVASSLMDFNYSNYTKSNSKDSKCTIAHRFGNFHDEYDIVSELGKGSFANCHICEQRHTRNQFAVKIIRKKESTYTSEEIEILLRFSNHPGIVQLYSVYENADNVYLIMELLTGGELIEYILTKKYLHEPEAAVILKTILEVIVYLHGHGVVHRDLKPSNILFKTRERRPYDIKICDMGFAKQLRAENGLLMTPCYTANYAAPEILKQQGYDSACDIWSIGVVLYIMLTGCTPFAFNPTDSPTTVLSCISIGKINFTNHIWCRLSKKVQNLLLNMLNINPNCRPKADELLLNEWLNTNCALYSNNKTREDICSQPFKSLKIEDYKKFRREVDATFKALVFSPSITLLGPIDESALAKRRFSRNQSIS